jgi:hypothetical protein
MDSEKSLAVAASVTRFSQRFEGVFR